MRIPIVGAHFHPPAKAVLEALPSGWSLVLIRDEGNEYDDKAIRVLTLLAPEEGSEAGGIAEMAERMEEAGCLAYGWSGEEILAQCDPCWLGFIARSGQKTAKGGPGNGEVIEAFSEFPLIATLCFDADGAACAGEFQSFEDSNMHGCDPWWERRPWNE